MLWEDSGSFTLGFVYSTAKRFLLRLLFLLPLPVREFVDLWSTTASIAQISWLLRRRKYITGISPQVLPKASRLTPTVLAGSGLKSTGTQFAREHHEPTQ